MTNKQFEGVLRKVLNDDGVYDMSEVKNNKLTNEQALKLSAMLLNNHSSNKIDMIIREACLSEKYVGFELLNPTDEINRIVIDIVNGYSVRDRVKYLCVLNGDSFESKDRDFMGFVSFPIEIAIFKESNNIRANVDIKKKQKFKAATLEEVKAYFEGSKFVRWEYSRNVCDTERGGVYEML